MANSNQMPAWPNGLPMPTTIPELVACIKAESTSLSSIDSFHDMLEPAARALWSLSYSNPSNQQLVAECGGISALAQLLTYVNRPDILQSASGCLWNLAANPDLHATVGSSGAIPLLVQLMQGECGTATTMEQAAGTLSTLANDHPGNCRQIALTGGITAVVRILCSPNSTDNARQYSASTLRSLALSDPANQQLITVSGGVMALLPLLRADRSSPALLQQAAMTVKILALDPDNQTIIAALGAIPVLVRLIGSSQEQAVLWSAAGALRNLICEHAINQATLVASPDALATLVRVLQDRTHAQSLLQQTIAIFTILSCNPHTHQALLTEPGCVTALLRLLDPTAFSPAVMEQAAASLALLSSNPSAHLVLRRVGAITALVRLLGATSSACDQLPVKQVGDTLFNLAHNSPSRQAAIRGAGGIAAIKQLLSHAQRATRSSSSVPGIAVDVLEQLLGILQSNLRKQSAPLFTDTPAAELVTEQQAGGLETSHNSASLAGMSLAPVRQEAAAAAAENAQASGAPDITADVDITELADTAGANADQAQFSSCATAEVIASSPDSVTDLDTDPQTVLDDLMSGTADAVVSVTLSGGPASHSSKSPAAQQGTKPPASRTAKHMAPPEKAAMPSGTANRTSTSAQSVDGTQVTRSSAASSWSDVVKMNPEHALPVQARSKKTVIASATNAAGKVAAAASKQFIEERTTAGPSWSSIVVRGCSRAAVAEADAPSSAAAAVGGPASTTLSELSAECSCSTTGCSDDRSADRPSMGQPGVSAAEDPNHPTAATVDGDVECVIPAANTTASAVTAAASRCTHLQKCLLCDMRPRSVLLLPCRHVVVCSNCADGMLQKAAADAVLGHNSKPVCPKCDVEVHEQLVVFHS